MNAQIISPSSNGAYLHHSKIVCAYMQGRTDSSLSAFIHNLLGGRSASYQEDLWPIQQIVLMLSPDNQFLVVVSWLQQD